MGVNRARVSIRVTVTAHRLYLGYMSCVVGSSPRCAIAPRGISGNAATIPKYMRKRELKAWIRQRSGSWARQAHITATVCATPRVVSTVVRVMSEGSCWWAHRRSPFSTTSGCAGGCCNVDDDGVGEDGPSPHCASGVYPVVPAKVMGFHCEMRTQCTARVTSLGQTDTTWVLRDPP